MDKKELAEYIDQQRWLLNSGLIPDSVKNQLFFCGSIVHKDVQAVEVHISPEKKLVEYTLYFDKSMLNKIKKYKELSTATSLFGMWRFKRLLKKEGSLDFGSMLNQFVADFCGPGWKVQLTLSDFGDYLDSIGDESGLNGDSEQPDQPAHQ